LEDSSSIAKTWVLPSCTFSTLTNGALFYWWLAGFHHFELHFMSLLKWEREREVSFGFPIVSSSAPDKKIISKIWNNGILVSSKFKL
jgi:hypothetical protein